jgi:hypothetical protein
MRTVRMRLKARIWLYGAVGIYTLPPTLLSLLTLLTLLTPLALLTLQPPP